MQSPSVDRRRRVRHKAQLPAYASLDRNLAGPAIELNEILDLSEDGMAIQASSAFSIDDTKTFLLDLPETQALIRTEGKVVWADRSGRAGIRFPALPADALFAVKKWLFSNVLAAYQHQRPGTKTIAGENAASTENLEEVAARPDHTEILGALGAVRREVIGVGPDLDKALGLLVQRAQVFCHATGAAIALTQGEAMICRANAGPDAPPLGANFKIGSGFSGECVRRGTFLYCADSETDTLVDRDSCRALGIRSIAATPIRWDAATIGLLEVFSPKPGAFGWGEEIILPKLAEIAAAAVHRAGTPEQAPPPAATDDEFSEENALEFSLSELPRSRNILLVATAVTLVIVTIWLVNNWRGAPAREQSVPQQATSSVSPAPLNVPASDLVTLRRLAEKGDPIAQFSLGARYATGEEIAQDYSEAVQWFSKAAEQGHVPAQATLGAYYWAGRGVPVDLAKAYFWSLLAEAGGDEASKSRVALLASRLSRKQILLTQQQANDWIRDHQLAGRNSAQP
ncbi:MAG TPA: GAF domain-containing protein [Terriglobales bacterium]|nr:GAF domain-containing protein [Terriglobales bacterium]